MLLSLYVLFWPRASAPPPFPGADKLVHLVLFALLAAAARWRFGRSLPVAVAVAAYAPVSEFVQGLLLPGRSGDPLDARADLVGAALGWVLAGWALARRR